MTNVLLVFIGSGFGGVVRYLVNILFLKSNSESIATMPFGFPVATLLVNIAASFAIGVLLALLQKQLLTPQQYLLLAVGFCGGLSTFSAFAVENQQMMSMQQFGMAALYIAVSVVGCIAAVAFSKYLVG